MRRALGILLSARTMFWLAFVWVFAYVSCSIWAREAFGMYMQAMSGSLLMQVPFVLFILIAIYNSGLSFLGRWRAGSRLGAVAWAVLPLGVILYMSGFFISASMRDQATGFFGRGDTVRPPWSQAGLVIDDFSTSIADEYVDGLEVEGVIFKYEPRLVKSSDRGRYEVGVFPPSLIGGSYYHIMDFGYAPMVTVSEGERVLVSGYVIQRILPPGIVDNLDLEGLPYRFELGMTPVRTIKKGEAEARVYDMQQPRYHVRVYKGEEMIFEGDSDKPIVFDGAHRLSLEGYDYWVWLEVSRTPGLAVMVAGIWVSAIGVPIALILAAMRLFGAARRIGANE